MTLPTDLSNLHIDASATVRPDLNPKPEFDVNDLAPDVPLLLLPVRIETRFGERSNGRFSTERVLRVRIYPDEIFANSHEPELTRDEYNAGCTFWRASWNESAEVQRRAWTELLRLVPMPRAAFVIRATKPSNFRDRAHRITDVLSSARMTDLSRLRSSAPLPPPAATEPDEPIFPPIGTVKSASWTRAVTASMLPDRWIVLAYRGTEMVRPDEYEPRLVHRAVSSQVLQPLALTETPSQHAARELVPADAEARGVAPIEMSRDVLWTIDFERAEQVGMAVTIPHLSEEDWDPAIGFDRILVVGVRTGRDPEAVAREVHELLMAQRFTRGVSFVAQGTATTNAGGKSTAFPPDDPSGEQSFEVEVAPRHAENGDGARLARALGLPAGALDRVSGAERQEHAAAGAMARVLFPITLGHFLEQLVNPSNASTPPYFTPSEVLDVRSFFETTVRARGPFSAFRVGNTPYGVLPVVCTQSLEVPADAPWVVRSLADAVRRARPIWRTASALAPAIQPGRSDPDADLLRVLGLQASSVAVGARTLVGPEFVVQLLRYSGLPYSHWISDPHGAQRAGLTTIDRAGWEPRLLRSMFDPRLYHFSHSLVARAGHNETAPLSAQDNYFSQSIEASIDALRRSSLSSLRGTDAPLLARLVRHSTLSEIARITFDVNLRDGRVTPADRQEHELIQTSMYDRRMRPPVWDHLAMWGEGATMKTIIDRDPLGADLVGFAHALGRLAALPAAELERLFTETLDAVSHRLDPWMTALATAKLDAMRAARPTGLHVGAFGWVERLRRRPPGGTRVLANGTTAHIQSRSAGFVHGPSLDHAAAGAILKNAWVTREGEPQRRYTIDLSSARVRTAEWILDHMRAGIPLGALLGYQVERGLHDIDPTNDRIFAALRQRFAPVARKKDPRARPDLDAAKIAARNVVDGLALLRAYRADESASKESFLRSLRLPLSPEQSDALLRVTREADDTADALADALTAESVFQLIRGNAGRSVASLDALARATRPPELEVARYPRTGRTLTHRVVLVLGDQAPDEVGPWGAVAPTPRAVCDPLLEAWARRQLGDPDDTSCVVRCAKGDAEATSLRVRLSDLGLGALDVVALAATQPDPKQGSEIDRRVRLFVLSRYPGVSIESVRYDAGASSSARTFGQTLEAARAMSALLGRSRPLRVEDLSPSALANPTPAAVTFSERDKERAEKAQRALGSLVRNLVRALRVPPASIEHAEDLHRQLQLASRYGVVGALPDFPAANLDAPYASLITSARSTLTELQSRLEKAESASNAREKARAIFGADFLFVSSISPEGAVKAALETALEHAPSLGATADQVRVWQAQATRVREPLRALRMVTTYARATSVAVAPVSIVQLPTEPGDYWAALPNRVATDPERQRTLLLSGRVSVALVGCGARATGATEWSGLLLDEWVETIPLPDETTGIAAHYDDPGAEAPQTVLLAVPTRLDGWRFDDLVATLHETLDNARIRATEPETLVHFAQFLPAAYVTANVAGDVVSTLLTNAITVEQPS
ncbi:MAG: hypothetical protein JNK05_31840 [Myxococcales bacterium]|nr:hypothetical protein [Myxococcales bacterium]